MTEAQAIAPRAQQAIAPLAVLAATTTYLLWVQTGIYARFPWWTTAILAVATLGLVAILLRTPYSTLVRLGLAPDPDKARLVKLRRGGAYGGILHPGTRHLEIHEIRGTAIQGKVGGFYDASAGDTYYVQQKIPRGAHLTLWFHNNPQPITKQEPQGFTSLHVDGMVGGKTRALVEGSWAGVPSGVNKKRLLVLLVVLLVLAGLYWWFTNRYGGIFH
jgi:hypothetical protein